MEDIEWNAINESHLLDAMVGHKPVGINKYFHMGLICEKFGNSLHKDIDAGKIWAHLETMYNLEALDESESIPFPNTEKDFSLPESDFSTFWQKKEEEDRKTKDQKTNDSIKTERKDIKKEEKTPSKSVKDIPRRDSKDTKDNRSTPLPKKEIKKESEKSAKQIGKSRNSTSTPKDEKKYKNEETPKLAKRPTRGSLKPSNDDSGSSGKSSPITVTPTSNKRRRI